MRGPKSTVVEVPPLTRLADHAHVRAENSDDTGSAVPSSTMRLLALYFGNTSNTATAGTGVLTIATRTVVDADRPTAETAKVTSRFPGDDVASRFVRSQIGPVDCGRVAPAKHAAGADASLTSLHVHWCESQENEPSPGSSGSELSLLSKTRAAPG